MASSMALSQMLLAFRSCILTLRNDEFKALSYSLHRHIANGQESRRRHRAKVNVKACFHYGCAALRVASDSER